MHRPATITKPGEQCAVRPATAIEGTPTQLHPGSPAHGLRSQPAAQGGEIEHHTERRLPAPIAPVVTGSIQLPAAPAVRHHRSRQSMALQGRQRQRRTAEGGLGQIGELVHQQHLHPASRQTSGQIPTSGTSAHHQHRGLDITVKRGRHSSLRCVRHGSGGGDTPCPGLESTGRTPARSAEGGRPPRHGKTVVSLQRGFGREAERMVASPAAQPGPQATTT